MGQIFTPVQNFPGPAGTGPAPDLPQAKNRPLQLAPESKSHRANQAYKRRAVVPSDLLAKVEPRKNGKNRQRNHFLDNLELKGGKFPIPKPVGRNLKAIFKKSNESTDDNDQKERLVLELQMPVPRNGHKNVGADEEQDSSHTRTVRQTGCRLATDTLVNGAARFAGSV